MQASGSTGMEGGLVDPSGQDVQAVKGTRTHIFQGIVVAKAMGLELWTPGTTVRSLRQCQVEQFDERFTCGRPPPRFPQHL